MIGARAKCPEKERKRSEMPQKRPFTIGKPYFPKFVFLEFYPRQDGSFDLVYVDAGGATVNIRGHVIGEIIDADVNNPPCEHHWHLKKE